MVTPYGLELVDNCATCAHRDAERLCHLDAETLGALDAIRFATLYPRGALLFVEGQEPRGVYVLCAGRVKLSTSAPDARVLITQIAGPGEVLGLSAVLAGTPYEVTAETIDHCRINFIQRGDFVRFLAAHGDASLRAARQLNSNYRTAFEQARLLGLSRTAAGKLARFLLAACAKHGQSNGRGVKLALTHEEIGQLIGASRETVTRLFSEFKHRRLIEVRGATLLVNNRPALEALARD